MQKTAKGCRIAWWRQRWLAKTLLVMRLTIVLMTVALLEVHAKGVSQSVSLTGKDMPVTKVFTVIKEQTGYTVFGNLSLLDNAKPVTIGANDMPLEEFLKAAMNEQPFNYELSDKMIILSKKISAPSVFDEEANNPPVTGIIRDAEGNPLPGVNVVVKGTRRGITTDAQGKFSIEAKENDMLLISSIGYNTREVKVTSVNVPYIIALEKNVSQLDEVQYIAYGKTSQRFSTGNIVSVRAEDIQKQPVNNPLLTLQGRVPGLTATQSTGVSGSAVKVRIQGRNNLNSGFTGTDPLIVIDGVPYPSQNLLTFESGFGTSAILGQKGNGGASGSTLAMINPRDIESIEILKDADATAIYGSRAANGVILITTKRGKTQGTKFDINLQTGWGKVGKKMDLLNSRQYLEMRREAKINDNKPITSTDYDLNGHWDTTRYTNWQKEMIGGTANYHQGNVTISGGAPLIKYLVGGTFSRETTVFPGNYANTKGSLHFSLNSTSLNKRLQFQLTGSFMNDDNELPGIDFTQYIALVPVAPSIYNSDGTLNWAPNVNGASTWINPISANFNIFENKSTNLIGNTVISYKILPSLEIKTSLGYNQLKSDQFLARLDESERPELRPTRTRNARFSNNSIISWIAEPQINYSTSIGWNNKLDVLAGATFQSVTSDGTGTFASGQNSDVLLRNLAAASYYSLSTINAQYRYSALFGRLNYSFWSRYLVNLSARRDGSSRFGASNLFHSFGAIGVGWIFSEEVLIRKKLRFLSFGKIRASYGTIGNDQINDYQFMTLFSPTFNSIPYQNMVGLQSTGISNPYLRWEETKKLQAGMDLGFAHDRYILSVNYYRNRTSNTLSQMKIPMMAGTGELVENFPALIQNSGWEFLLRMDVVKSRKFTWSGSFNFTIPKNELLSFPNMENSIYSGDLLVGYPLDIVRNYSFHGIDPQTGAILFRNFDGHSTSSLDFEKDRIAILDPTEKFYGGFQNNFYYRNIGLDFLFQFIKQDGLNYPEFGNAGRFSPTSTAFYGNHPTTVLNRWQKPGDLTFTPPYTTSTSPRNMGDRPFADASFIRLKNISLSYQFPKTLLGKIKIKEGQVFINGQNLFTVTDYLGLDPETQSVTTLPPLRVFVIGLRVTL